MARANVQRSKSAFVYFVYFVVQFRKTESGKQKVEIDFSVSAFSFQFSAFV